MHPAARLQFERLIGEYARWRAVPETERSPAPAWWWGPAMELRSAPQSLPAEWCAELGLPNQATYAAAAELLLKAIAGQTTLPWPDDFPRKASDTKASDTKLARELHPQPSDDSAFQP
ncbi:hypothetical protein V1277_004040 [Bradyrhizobium sp. AZCC 1588]|uniref:hypothetical protein n=1 Tax=unclassified Bradyrhizobium TaxID=2631580 RepID=UPI002FF406B9